MALAAFPVVVFSTSVGKLNITWKKQLSLEFPYTVPWAGKMKFRASLAFDFPKQADPLFCPVHYFSFTTIQ